MRTLFVVVLCLAGCSQLQIDSDRTDAEPRKDSITSSEDAKWQQAVVIWQTFAEKHLANARTKMPEARLEWVEYRSDWVREFLPDYQIHVLVGYCEDDASAIFALSRTGKIYDLGQGNDWVYRSETTRQKQFNAFLASANIVLDTEERAVVCMWMIQRLGFAPCNLAYRLFENENSPGVDVFDDGRTADSWIMTAERNGSAWYFAVERGGPPIYEGAPPLYALHVAEDDRLMSVSNETAMIPIRLWRNIRPRNSVLPD